MSRKKTTKASPELLSAMKAIMDLPQLTEFERGAFWALDLLTKQLRERYESYRKISSPDQDMAGVVGAASNICSGIRSAFESELIRSLKDAQKDSL